MTKHCLTLLAACLLLASCNDIDYDGTTKIVFKGKVTGPDGTSMANVPVKIMISDGNEYEESSSDITDANGNFLAVSPGAFEKVSYSVEIAGTGAVYYNILPELLDDYLVDTGTTKLYYGDDYVVLTIASEIPNTLQKVNVLGAANGNYIDYTFNLPVDYQDDVRSYYYHYTYIVAPNQDVVVKYMLLDNTVLEETVHIGTEDLTHTLSN